MYHKDMFIEYIMRTSAESDRVDRDFKRSMGNPSSLYTWKNPATERVFQLLIGEMPCIHSVKKSSSRSNTASESSLSKTLGVSYRNALQFVHSVWGDDSSPALTPHSPLWRQGQRQECPETLKTGSGSRGFTFRNKSTRIRYISSTAPPDDRLLNRHLWLDRLHRCRFSRCDLRSRPAFRPTCREESKGWSKLTSDSNNFNGTNHEHTRPTCTDYKLRYCLLRTKHLQTESRATAVKSFLRERARIQKGLHAWRSFLDRFSLPQERFYCCGSWFSL